MHSEVVVIVAVVVVVGVVVGVVVVILMIVLVLTVVKVRGSSGNKVYFRSALFWPPYLIVPHGPK